jgi:geranylgeranyl diphosphate synthase type I
MTYREYFLPYVQEIDHFLAHYFRSKKREAKKITPVGAETWQKLENFIKGGKRIRGGLVKLGYECFQRADSKKILPASAAMEITHGALLVHDDIIDASDFRHHQPTVHKQYEKKYRQKKYLKGEVSHYGTSMGIVVGIEGYYGAFELLVHSQFSEKNKVAAIKEFCKFIMETGYGEALDVDLGYRLKVREKEVLTIHTYKTAQYTLVGPLKIGGLLAGATPRQVKKFENYGLPVGIAFQLQDDFLGMFGTERELGKPVGDDLKEGKNTLLYTQAVKKGNPSQKKQLMSLWGRQSATLKEVKMAQKIIEETGSLAYSQRLARKLVAKGKKSVSKLTSRKELQEVFYSLADYIVERKK